MNHLTYHEDRDEAWFDAEYNLRAGRPDYELTVIPGWTERSKAARADLDCTLNVVYGEGSRQKMDVFRSGNASAPTLIYIHGGYWQRGDKAIYSFIATPFVAAGINVVIVGYDLCPEVSITEISEELRQAVTHVHGNAGDLGLNANRILVMGHSAGGHLTQMMMATDWAARGLPADTVKAGIPVSPLSLLEPVRRTTALNTGIRMDEAEAARESPMQYHPPLTNAPQMVVTGGAETNEFHRQARMYVEKFETRDRPMSLYVVPGVDHFDELNVLTDPNSLFFAKVLAMLNAT